MAGSSLLILIDDITLLLDDVAAMSKVAAKKTAGVLGDDLALNAQQVSGIRAERELPVVWGVAKGSFKNKVILVPAALGLSAFAPWSIMPILMLGGAYLCFEGFEKIAHPFLGTDKEEKEHQQELIEAFHNPDVDLEAYEKEKIEGAIRTDFILSAEIIVIALGTVADKDIMTQTMVVSGIAVAITIGVYGLVAAIVKMDDVGLHLLQNAPAGKRGAPQRTLGQGLLSFAPKLMKILTVVGTAAMFLVGGSILLHGIPDAHHVIESAVRAVQTVPVAGGVLGWMAPVILDAVAGIVAGGIVMGAVAIVSKIVKAVKK
jgi:predicted DNA repair protein MutK